MAVRYAALSACHFNSLGGATWRSVMITGRTDRQTDRQSATQYAAPPREEGPHNNTSALELSLSSETKYDSVYECK